MDERIACRLGGSSFIWAKMHAFFVSILFQPSAVLFKIADAVVVDVMLFH